MKETIGKWSSRLRIALLTGTLMFAGSTVLFERIVQAKENAKAPPARLNVDNNPVTRDGKFTTSFSPVVKKVAPSVVKVSTSTKPKQIEQRPSRNDRSNPLFNDPLFRRFFGDGADMEEGMRRFRTPRQQGLGSGVVVTEDGYILTNNHVVDNADEVKVALPDGHEYTAKVIGKDRQTDVAVLKIEAKGLPALKLADSDQIEVGDVVLAVGNPFGIGQTVTMGMVSALGRGTPEMDLTYQDFIQTDAAINPGNSGGPLIDAEGRLIGINTSIISRSGGNEGIGFAIPINLAKGVMQNLIDHGKVSRGFMGVRLQHLTPALANEFGLKDSAGAIVAQVEPKSPAEKAGLENGDIITELNGKPVRDSRHLQLQVGQTPPGEKVTLKFLRDGKRKEANVTLKERPDAELAADRSADEEESDDALHGVAVADIDGKARSQYRLPTDVDGAIVVKVDEDSPAFEAGLRPGDVIQEINRKPVSGSEDAVKLTQKMKTKKILLRIWSRGGSQYLVVDESKGD
jgi:serine protease Do